MGVVALEDLTKDQLIETNQRLNRRCQELEHLLAKEQKNSDLYKPIVEDLTRALGMHRMYARDSRTIYRKDWQEISAAKKQRKDGLVAFVLGLSIALNIFIMGAFLQWQL